MKIEHDAALNVAYLRFGTTAQPVTTLTLSADVKVDITAEGTIVGIELLNANEQLKGDEGVPEVQITVDSATQRIRLS